MLESGQAALVVVAVNQTIQEIAGLLTHSTHKIVTDCCRADFNADLAATTQPPPERQRI